MEINSGTVEHFSNIKDDPNSLSDNIVTAINMDSSGSIWIGTFLRGLNKVIIGEQDRSNLQKLSFVRYLNDPENPYSISSNSISMIYTDTRGNCWVGTWDNGLNKIIIDESGEDIRFRRYTIK